MADEVPVVGEVGVRGRADHAGEVLGLGQRIFEMDHGQEPDQGGGFAGAQRPNRLVSLQEGRRPSEVGGGAAGLGQVEPGHYAALHADGQVVYGERPVGQAEVEDPGHASCCRGCLGTLGGGPGQVGRMPVTVCPLPGQRRQKWSRAAEQRGQVGREVVSPAAPS